MSLKLNHQLHATLQNNFSYLSSDELSALTAFGLALRSGRGILFLGAGVSIDSGIPSGNELISYFQRKTDSNSANLRTLCTLFESKTSEYLLKRTLSELLNDWNKPLSPVHNLVPKLPKLKTVITTNIDTRLEEACRIVRRPYQTFTLPQDLRYGRPDYLHILKIHGTLEHPHTFVFSDQAFKKLEANDKKFKDTFQNKLRNLFLDNEVLTIGYSAADDPDFEDLISWMASDIEGKQLLSIQLDGAQAQLCRRKGVTPIVLPDKDNIPGLLGFLADLPANQIPRGLTIIDRRHNPFHRLEPYCEQDANRIIGREEDLQMIFSALLYHKILVLFGDSAVGKTSFLRAALIPHFQKTFRNCEIALETVADDLPAYWQLILRKIPKDQVYLLILDQFERFFEPSIPEKDRADFVRSALTLTKNEYPTLYCLFTIRRESFPELHRYKTATPGLFHESVELRSLKIQEATEVIRRHFGDSGYNLEDEVIDSIVQKSCLGDTPFLPALQLYGYAQFEHLEPLRQHKEISTYEPIPKNTEFPKPMSFMISLKGPCRISLVVINMRCCFVFYVD